ncbi:hypothetical protein L1987_85957 [Smallanthus sonchifolius]|uniref:Uncharacterized protein n=1 Tax=Smallanthus sonchifolius TaxID=185202 RepID=A0ACB8XY61_9ASTR|nr:hypothetical protein L1987_85957 [Smallanthus sonchifolius]
MLNDRQKGIIQAVEKLFPHAEHRFCLRHINENMKQRFKGKAYKDLLWSLATSTAVEFFEEKMNELKTFNTDAQLWLSNIPLKHWSKAYFSSRAHSDSLFGIADCSLTLIANALHFVITLIAQGI